MEVNDRACYGSSQLSLAKLRSFSRTVPSSLALAMALSRVQAGGEDGAVTPARPSRGLNEQSNFLSSSLTCLLVHPVGTVWVAPSSSTATLMARPCKPPGREAQTPGARRRRPW